MAIKFQPTGPFIEIEGTTIRFKRVSQDELNEWNLKNNPFKSRPQEEQTKIYSLIRNGKVDEVEYTQEELNSSLSQLPRFALDFCTGVDNLQDHSGQPIKWDELSEEMKFILFEELYSESDEFRDFLIAYKAGVKKKSS